MADASPYLATVDQQAAVDILWDLLTGNSYPSVTAIATAAAAHPVLRALRPWISHGTLHLLHPVNPVSSQRHGLAFAPFDEARVTVFEYGGLTSTAQDADTAAETAAATASARP
jgi:hypothetical protein